MKQLHVTITIDAPAPYTADDCDHAALMGVIRNALLSSDRFCEVHAGRLVGLVADRTPDTMRDEPYRSAFRVPGSTLEESA